MSAQSAALRALTSSESPDWYTPQRYIDLVRKVLGDIDLDPATCVTANLVVNAREIFTEADNGLAQEWHGRVFLNPPYGRGNIAGQWTRKLISEYGSGRVTEAIALLRSTTGDQWWQVLWSYPICFVDHRIQFYGQDGTGNTVSSVFVYFGKQPALFARVFASIGQIVTVTRNTCTVCGSKFVPRRPEAKTCSNACRQRAYRRTKR